MDVLDSKLVSWYRSLNSLERIAVRAWLRHGDSRILEWLLPQQKTLRQFNLHCTSGTGDEEDTQPVMTI
jgi:hypothetical protein